MAFWQRSPEPRHPTFRWALHATTAFFRKRTYLIGLLLLPVAAGFAGAVGAPQASNGKNPSGLDRGAAAVVAYLAALVGLIVVVYLVCLVIAPYRQKRDLVEAEERRAADAETRRKAAAASDPLDDLLDLIPQRDPVELGLEKLYVDGTAAMKTFETSEVNLWQDEVDGRPPPQGRGYDEWHELGRRDLKKWLSGVDSAVEELMGDEAAALLRAQRGNSPLKPVKQGIGGAFENLWLDCAHRLDWIRKEYNARSTGNIYGG